MGRFDTEIWVMSFVGIYFTNFTKAQKDKIFPETTKWEIMKPSLMDLYGVGGSWLLVLLINY